MNKYFARGFVFCTVWKRTSAGQEPGRSHEDIFRKRHKCRDNQFPSAVVFGCVAVTLMCNIPDFYVKDGGLTVF